MMAVLPFENLSDDPAQAYLGVGITDELIAQLGALQPARLGVIARTTVEQYRRAGRSIREIGRELNVQYVLEGSVRREGARGRITARLIQVSDQTQLWAATYERDFRDTLLTEHEVALRVASSLAMSVLAAPASGRMPHPESYDHYLRGRYLRLQATEASLRRAQEHFEQAITLDPRYADAHAGLADALLTMGAPGWEIEAPGVLLERAKVAVDRALELDPRHAEAYAVRALIKLDLDRDPSGAERDIERALSLNPSLARAHQYSSSILTATGRFDEAITAAAAAQALDPLSPGTGTTLGFRHYYAGAYEPALAAFRDVLETAPGFGQAHLGLAQTLRELGRTDQSIQELEKAVASGGNSTYLEARLGHAYAVGGRIEAARQVLEQLRSQAERRYVSPFHFALIHAGLGDESAMFDALERAKQDRSGWLAWLGVEREFAPFASHRRFAALLAP
jgi:TolB-like protein/thioredoxin-like negative regulator of GroEL